MSKHNEILRGSRKQMAREIKHYAPVEAARQALLQRAREIGFSVNVARIDDLGPVTSYMLAEQLEVSCISTKNQSAVWPGGGVCRELDECISQARAAMQTHRSELG